MGMTSANAAPPTAGTATFKISSVAYAEEERLSDANTASAVGLPSRSCFRLAVGRAGPRTARFRAYPGPCGSGDGRAGAAGRTPSVIARLVAIPTPLACELRPGRVSDP